MVSAVYLNSLSAHFSPAHWTMVQLLLLLVQQHRLIRLEQLAALWPQPIHLDSRRRALQRLLLWLQWQQQTLWYPWLATVLASQVRPGQRVYIAMDRTQWSEHNLLIVSLLWRGRALPLSWVYLGKLGSSNRQEQQAVMLPLLPLLAAYDVVVLGDREFHGVEWASWLQAQGLQYVLRLPTSTYIQLAGGSWQAVKRLPFAPGMKLIWQGVKVTKSKGERAARHHISVYQRQRRHQGQSPEEPWYLLTNLADGPSAVAGYRQRMGIEMMFRDYKSGGYNLESCRVSQKRLESLLIVVAIAYVVTGLEGERAERQRLGRYVGRPREESRAYRRHSLFRQGL